MGADNCCPGCEDQNKRSLDGLCTLYKGEDGLDLRCDHPWALEKHYFIRRYADIFSTGMKRKWKYRVYIDLFAGPGRSRIPPDAIVDGSPLIAAAQDFTHLYLVDLSPDCVNSLFLRVTSTYPDKTINVSYGDCNDLAGPIADQVAGLGPDTLALAVLDPHGIEIKYATIRQLAQKIDRLDLLITFPLGMNIQRQFWQRREADGAAFDEYFGSPEWRNIPELRAELVYDFYIQQLQNLGYPHVGRPEVIKNRLKNKMLYYLVYLTRHARGLDFWRKSTKKDMIGQKWLFEE